MLFEMGIRSENLIYTTPCHNGLIMKLKSTEGKCFRWSAISSTLNIQGSYWDFSPLNFQSVQRLHQNSTPPYLLQIRHQDRLDLIHLVLQGHCCRAECPIGGPYRAGRVVERDGGEGSARPERPLDAKHRETSARIMISIVIAYHCPFIEILYMVTFCFSTYIQKLVENYLEFVNIPRIRGFRYRGSITFQTMQTRTRSIATAFTLERVKKV